MREWTTLFITEGRYNWKGLYIYCYDMSVISALNKGYHLSRDYVVPNEVYNTCNESHHIQCLHKSIVHR